MPNSGELERELEGELTQTHAGREALILIAQQAAEIQRLTGEVRRLRVFAPLIEESFIHQNPTLLKVLLGDRLLNEAPRLICTYAPCSCSQHYGN